MKVILLAGGLGSRLQEETVVKPKPMVEIGGRPILWHIMKSYDHFNFKEFIIALGYKGEVIKDYFINFNRLKNDISIDLKTTQTTLHSNHNPDWKVHLIDTGLNTLTGGRIKRLRSWVNNELFFVTYGDGLADLNIRAVLDFHLAHGKIATVSAVRPPARFGGLAFNSSGQVSEFSEKPEGSEGWVNGGFFVLNPAVFDFIDGDLTSFEREPLERLTQAKELMAYRHEGFFQPMDTLREKQRLEELWSSGHAPWKLWNE